MSPNGISSGFGEILIFSSSDSSESEFLLQEDINTRGNQITKQWEAIERTLYQEPGQQVTDPELLKECKLWRETFPHFRVKGTKMEVKKTEEPDSTDKNVQTLQNHFNLKVLEEKRKSIKKKVVNTLVERIIAKFGSEKRESAKSERESPRGVQITEVDEETAEAISRRSADRLSGAEKSLVPSPVGVEKESYFERGKHRRSSPENLTAEEMEEKLYKLLDSWDEPETATKAPETAAIVNPRKLANPNSLVFKTPEKSSSERLNPPRKAVPRPDYLSTIAKPFEMTKKIDKKYEGLVERIMERQCNGLGTRRHCRTSSSGLEKSCQESLAKLRIGSGYDEYLKGRSMPKLSKLSNNWLERSELNFYQHSGGDHARERRNRSRKPTESFYSESASQREIDERFLEELKREMASNYKRPPRRSGVVEEISLRRPKPFRSTPEMTVKSSNLGDLTKKNKKEIKGGSSKRGFEVGAKDSSVKCRVKQSAVSKGNKASGSQGSLLPPIEAGIICTELTGRPKIGPKNPPKRS